MSAKELTDLEMLAAEFALGSLDGSDRRRAQDLAQRNDAFARLVEQWQERLVPLAETVPVVEPPQDLWRRIEQELRPAPAMAHPAVPAPVAASPAEGLFASLAFWRWTTFGAGGFATVAALFALYVSVLGNANVPAAQRYVAVLNAGEAKPALVVTIDPTSNRMTIRPVQTEKPQNTALQLWLVAGDTPQSLGLLDPISLTSLDLAPQTGTGVRGAALAVSLEPVGGSPTGLPTGPVLYHGKVLPLDD